MQFWHPRSRRHCRLATATGHSPSVNVGELSFDAIPLREILQGEGSAHLGLVTANPLGLGGASTVEAEGIGAAPPAEDDCTA